jgi:hypothetical protein
VQVGGAPNPRPPGPRHRNPTAEKRLRYFFGNFAATAPVSTFQLKICPTYVRLGVSSQRPKMRELDR